MLITCAFCGKSFECYDNRIRKYCPECQKSGKRYNQQFRERLKGDDILQNYVSNYSRRHALHKKGKLPKAVLDEWRHQARIKRHEISIGKITVEDFKVWCDVTYNAIKGECKRG